jgi:hypothetical protein
MRRPDNNEDLNACQTHQRERRAALRHLESHDAKVFRSGGHGYMAAQTVDWSESGALVEVRTGRAIRVGERVQVGIGFSKRAVMLGQELRSGTIVRSERCKSGCVRVAVAFDRSMMMAA